MEEKFGDKDDETEFCLLGMNKIQVPPPLASLQERIVLLVNQAIVMIFIKGNFETFLSNGGFSQIFLSTVKK